MKERFLSYAQEFEDVILYNVLKDVEIGFYIDVGASDPWIISVTKAFYERGWHGINIEPLEEEFNYLFQDRKRDINLNMGAGNHPGEVNLFQAGTGSTIKSELLANPDSAVEKTIIIDTLENICELHIGPTIIGEVKKEIHFCKIDVEGYEKEVLEGFSYKKYRPWIL